MPVERPAYVYVCFGTSLCCFFSRVLSSGSLQQPKEDTVENIAHKGKRSVEDIQEQMVSLDQQATTLPLQSHQHSTGI